MERLAVVMDRWIDHHPFMARLTYVFTAVVMTAFVIYTG